MPVGLIATLCSDPDPFVATKAQEENARRKPKANKSPKWTVGIEDDTPPAELDESALHLPIGGMTGKQGAGGRTISLEELKATRTFEEAWTVLGRGALPTRVSTDMDGSWLPGNEDRIVEYAQQAASENREVVREALGHLTTLYTSAYRVWLIRDLGHPSRGLFAKFLLAREPRDRELLAAIQQNPKAAHRVAELAVGTPLALAVVDELVAGIAGGTLTIETSEHSWEEPRLMRTLRELGGREAMFRLLLGATDERGVGLALGALLHEHRPAQGEVSAGTAAAARAWVKENLGDEGRDPAQLLNLLALCGDTADVAFWRAEYDTRALPMEVASAVVRLVGQRGTADEAPWLREIAMTTDYASVVDEVAKGLLRLGGLENARWLMARFDDPPPCVAKTRAAWKAWSDRLDAVRAEARAAGRSDVWELRPEGPEPPHAASASDWEGSARVAIVQHGDDELGMQLAWRLANDQSAIELCEEHGRLPSHALLVLGAIEHDPGEYVVGGRGEMTEVVGSGVPDRVRKAVEGVVRRCGGEAVRRTLFVAMLEGYAGSWGSGESYGLLENIFMGLGGPRPGDLQDLLAQLEERPDDPTALRYLARMNLGERELLALWRRLGVHWLASP